MSRKKKKNPTGEGRGGVVVVGGVKTNDVDPSLFFLYALIPVRVIREHCDLLSAKRKSASERIRCSGGH